MTTQPTRQGPQPTWMRNLIKSVWLGRNVFMPSFGTATRLSANDIRERLSAGNSVGDHIPPLRTVQRILSDFREVWDVAQELSKNPARPLSAEMGWPKDHDDTAFLAALIRSWGVAFHPDHQIHPDQTDQEDDSEAKEIPIDAILPGENAWFRSDALRALGNPIASRELKESIQANGVIRPIILEKKQTEDGYEIVDGLKRLAACLELGLETIPAFVTTQEPDAGDQSRSRQNSLGDLLPLAQKEVEIALQLKSVLGYPQEFAEGGGVRVPWELKYEFFDSPIPGELALIKELALRQAYIESANDDAEKTRLTQVYDDHSDIINILMDRPWRPDSPWRKNTFFDEEQSFQNVPSQVLWPVRCLRWNSIYLSGNKEQGRGHFQSPMALRRLINGCINGTDLAASEKAWEILNDLCPTDTQWTEIGLPAKSASPLPWEDFILARNCLEFIDSHECFKKERRIRSEIRGRSPRRYSWERNRLTLHGEDGDGYDGGWGLLEWGKPHDPKDEPQVTPPVDDIPLMDDSNSPENIWIGIQPDEWSILQCFLSVEDPEGFVLRELNLPYVLCSDCGLIFTSVELLYRGLLRALRWDRTVNTDKGVELLVRIIKTRVGLAQARDVVQDYNAVLRIQVKQDWLDAVAPPSARSDMWPEAFLEELKKDIADLSISRNQKIIQNYDQAISITPNAAEPFILRGFLFFQQDDYIRAIDDFTEAERLLRNSDAPSMMLGFTHYLRGLIYLEFHDSEQSDSDVSVKSAGDLMAAMELLPPEESGRWDELKSSYAERFASRDTVHQNLGYWELAREALDDLQHSLYGGPRNLNAFFGHIRRTRWGEY